MFSLYDITRVCPKLEPHSSPDENENHDQDHVTDHVESQEALLLCNTETLDCTQRKLDCEAVAKENGSANDISDHEVSSSDQLIKSYAGFDAKHSIEYIYSTDTNGETAGPEILAYQTRAVHQKSNRDTRLSDRIGTRCSQGTWLPYHAPTDQSEAVYHQGAQGTMLPYDLDKDQMTVYQGATPRTLHHNNSNRATQATALPNGTSTDHAAVYQGITQGAMSHEALPECQGSTQGAVVPHYDICSYRTLAVPQGAMSRYYINTNQELHSGKSSHRDTPAYGEKRPCCCSCHVTKFSTSHFPAFGEQHQRPSVIMVPTKWRETEASVWTPKDHQSTLNTIPRNRVFQPELHQRQAEESNSSDSSDGGEDEPNEEKYFRKNMDGTTAKFKLSKEDWERIPINTFPSGGRLLSGDWTRIFLDKVKESNPWCSLRFKNNHVRSENSRKIHSAVFFRGGAECKRPECNVKVRFVIRKEKGKYVDVTYVGNVCHSGQPGGSDVTNANRRSKRVHKPRILED